MREIGENSLIKSIDKHIESIITILSEISVLQTKGSKKDYDIQSRKLQELQEQKINLQENPLYKDSIPALQKRLTDARYNLLASKGVEALFYKRNRKSQEIYQESLKRIPLKGQGLEDEFETLKDVSDQYRILCYIRGYSYLLGFNDFQQWKSYIADPPTADNTTFYIETVRIKRGVDFEDKLNVLPYVARHPVCRDRPMKSQGFRFFLRNLSFKLS